LRQDNRELIDKATALYRQDKMDKEYLDNYSREQEKWISDNISDNISHLNREIDLIKSIGESAVKDLEADFEAEMYNMEEEEKKAQDQDCTSEVGQEKPDTGNTYVESPKSESNTSQSKPSVLDEYADLSTEPFDPFDPDL